jgi:hypothetical protein
MADTIEQHPSIASGPPQYRANEEKVDSDLSRDDTLLATLGYKAELKREFTALEVFGLAFSIIGLLPSIASTLVYSMPAGGPVGMVCICQIQLLIIGVGMAHCCLSHSLGGPCDGRIGK